MFHVEHFQHHYLLFEFDWVLLNQENLFDYHHHHHLRYHYHFLFVLLLDWLFSLVVVFYWWYREWINLLNLFVDLLLKGFLRLVNLAWVYLHHKLEEEGNLIMDNSESNFWFEKVINRRKWLTRLVVGCLRFGLSSSSES
jgi:hypothetical protein